MASSLISRRFFLSPKPFPLLLRACPSPPPPPPPPPFQVHSQSFSSNRRKKRLQKKFVPHQIPHPKITPPVDTPKTDDPNITPPSTESRTDSLMVTLEKGGKFVETVKRGQDGFEYVLAIGGAGFNFYDKKLTAVKEYLADRTQVPREKFGLKGNSSPSPAAGNTPSPAGNTPATTPDNPLLKKLVDIANEILTILKNNCGELNRKCNGKAKNGKVVKKGEGNGMKKKNGNGNVNGNGEEAQENGSDADSNE